MQKIKLFLYNHKTWVYNLQYILLSVLLIILVSLIDLRILPIQEYIPSIIKMDLDLSKMILTTLAGALLTITTFTFSTILVILNTYSSNYSPRVVENFINMKITMQVLGIYIGGFFYCIVQLLFMRTFFDKELVIAGFVAVIYSIVCIVYFVKFVQTVMEKFQGVNIIADISEEASRVIEKEVEIRNSTPEYAYDDSLSAIEIISDSSGYLSLVDYEKILDLLEGKEGLFNINAKIGEYVSEKFTLGLLNIDESDIEDELKEKLKDCFYIQDKKVVTSDYRYNLTKLSEIALRALSPGINDPNTAIHCIRKLGVLLKELASTNSTHILQAEKNSCEVFYSAYNFEEDLFYVYMQIVHYGQSDYSVILATLESLWTIYNSSTEKNKAAIRNFVAFCNDKTRPNFNTEYESENLNKYFQLFEYKEA